MDEDEPGLKPSLSNKLLQEEEDKRVDSDLENNAAPVSGGAVTESELRHLELTEQIDDIEGNNPFGGVYERQPDLLPSSQPDNPSLGDNIKVDPLVSDGGRQPDLPLPNEGGLQADPLRSADAESIISGDDVFQDDHDL